MGLLMAPYRPSTAAASATAATSAAFPGDAGTCANPPPMGRKSDPGMHFGRRLLENPLTDFCLPPAPRGTGETAGGGRAVALTDTAMVKVERRQVFPPGSMTWIKAPA